MSRHVDGVLLLDKPVGITSNAALARVKRLYEAEKAGHTGTLDPLASGLLPICLGEATKLARFLLDAPKRYLATVRFGVTTTTLDGEGEVLATHSIDFHADALLDALSGFVGPQRQTPPAHAALKFEGRPYYSYARKGVDIPRAPRAITVHALRLVHFEPPTAVLDVECSKGTYVRVLAADLGAALGCGAHLAGLRRTASGGFDIGNAVTLAAVEAMDSAERDRRLLPASVLVGHLPALRVDAEAARRFVNGGGIAAEVCADGLAAIFDADRLLGVADVAAGIARPSRVLVQHDAAAPDQARISLKPAD
jgi:tRNA pseudouridine55 synthase